MAGQEYAIMPKGKTIELISKYVTILKEAGIDSAEFEMELILCYVLNLDRLHLYLHGDELIDDEIVNKIESIVERRRTRFPLQYILNESWFFGRKYFVDESVMIPTPETEQVCQTAIAFLSEKENSTVLDIGTGSGVIAITLAAEVTMCQVIATDICKNALATAMRNANYHKVSDRIKFRHSDLFEKISSSERFDLIIANPPYISEEDYPGLPPEVIADPKIALTSGKEGLDIITEILAEAPQFLNDNGRIMLEIGYNQSEAISQKVKSDSRYKSYSILQDLNGIDRTIILSCNG
jgi:release factor glutamine methyltransferase